MNSESKLSGENTMVVLGGEGDLLLFGAWAVGLGSVDVKVAIDVGIEDGVSPCVVDTNVINAGSGT